MITVSIEKKVIRKQPVGKSVIPCIEQTQKILVRVVKSGAGDWFSWLCLSDFDQCVERIAAGVVHIGVCDICQCDHAHAICGCPAHVRAKSG